MKNNWNKLGNKIEKQTLKQKIYDDLLFDKMGNLRNKKVLDFGCGTGEIALRAEQAGARVWAYDSAIEMRHKTAKRIGKNKVFEDSDKIPFNSFDIVISNLLLCIVDEKEVENIMDQIKSYLKPEGVAFIGFCNPLEWNKTESLFQKRKVTGKNYQEFHEYTKIIKENEFQIADKHRPLEFYENVFRKNKLNIEKKYFSEDSKFGGKGDSDFIIYKLSISQKSYKICVIGAWRNYSTDAEKAAIDAGRWLAKNKHTLITGACLGIPLLTAKSYHKSNGINSIGYSPANDQIHHKEENGLATDKIFHKLVFMNSEKPLSYSERNIVNIRNSDAVIVISGRLGALMEYTIAQDEQKPIGVVEGVGEASNIIRSIENSMYGKEKSIFTESISDLLPKLIAKLDSKN